MNTSIPGIAPIPSRLGLSARLGILIAVLAGETVLASYFIQLSPLTSLTGGAALLHDIQHWLFRFLIAYVISLAMLAYLRAQAYSAAAAVIGGARTRWGWLAVHIVLLAPFLLLSARLYEAAPSAAVFWTLAIAWHAAASGAALALFAALAPLAAWREAVRRTGNLPLYAVLPAAAAVAVITVSQMLWAPAAKLTFHIVNVLLHPLLPALHSDASSMVLGTGNFAVQIAEQCSGLEGMGLVLAFCGGWLWLFRRDFYFPRALLIVPLGLVVVFLLNALRIAAIVLIGNAGYPRVAILGFHSQAGWIGFNLTAFGIAVLAQRTPWLSRVAHRAREQAAGPSAHDPGRIAEANPTAAYLVPFLAILAAGMVSHAASAGFEFLYPLRLVAAAAALWAYRRRYLGADLRFTWRGPAVGVGMFGLWAGIAALSTHAEGAPAALSSLPDPLRELWIFCRAAAAVLTVPLAEELAYRGYLMRRLVSPRFETVPFAAVRWPALGLSAVAFGLMHGALWLPGIVVGLAYGALAMRTGKLGESVAAHATTNALLAAYVLSFGQWQLW